MQRGQKQRRERTSGGRRTPAAREEGSRAHRQAGRQEATVTAVSILCGWMDGRRWRAGVPGTGERVSSRVHRRARGGAGGHATCEQGRKVHARRSATAVTAMQPAAPRETKLERAVPSGGPFGVGGDDQRPTWCVVQKAKASNRSGGGRRVNVESRVLMERQRGGRSACAKRARSGVIVAELVRSSV